MTERDVITAVATALGSTPAATRAVGGGDINHALQLTLADGRTIFVKHHPDPPAGMFAAEARGLAWLAAAGVDAVTIPRVLAVAEHYLALELLDGTRASDFSAALGRGLAALHASGAPSFGLDHANFIAILPQDNTPAATWRDFYLDRRLAPMIDRAAARSRTAATWRARLDTLRARWPIIAGPDEPPARLHGDLWSGNVHAHAGAPALIDPAVYGGHREIDLAMLALFGGLSATTVAAYAEVHPLADGWRDRVPLYQLYPLLVHTVLFGGGYGAQVDAILAALT